MAKKMGLLGLIKQAAREAATAKFGAMAIGDVAAARTDDWLEEGIEAAVDFGLDFDLHEDLCGEFTDAFAEESEELADAAGLGSKSPAKVIARMVKTCGCGKGFTAEQWAALPLKGIQPSEDETGKYSLELRNCPCGSTIGIESRVS